ncbi:MAG: hypothetical protein WCY79_07355 [Bacteroidales bacterium]
MPPVAGQPVLKAEVLPCSGFEQQQLFRMARYIEGRMPKTRQNACIDTAKGTRLWSGSEATA